jgi:uncharacterized membrane protein
VRLVAMMILVVGLGCTPGPTSREAPSPSPSPTSTADTLRSRAGLPDSLARVHDLLAGLELQALGNEPFWSVEISRNAIIYRDPEHLGGIPFPYAPPSGRAIGLVFESTRPDSTPRSIRVVIEQRECSDGMSDLRYRYASDVRLDSLVLRGCARFRPPRRSH